MMPKGGYAAEFHRDGAEAEPVRQSTVVKPSIVVELFGADVAELVRDVTDDKTLLKTERKRLQVEEAPHKSDRAKMLKIADKTSNLRAMAVSPPSGWNEQRKRDYFAWALAVVAGCRGVNSFLEAKIDQSYRNGQIKQTHTT